MNVQRSASVCENERQGRTKTEMAFAEGLGLRLDSGCGSSGMESDISRRRVRHDRGRGRERTLALGRVLVRREPLLDTFGHPARGPVTGKSEEYQNSDFLLNIEQLAHLKGLNE